jgi:trehalose 6-phosphate phosphatase
MLSLNELNTRLADAGRLYLFLDYDGTLADFAPTPEHIQTDPALIDLLRDLNDCSRIRLAVVSGRRLDQVRALLPMPGLLLSGTYGIEIQTPEGKRLERVSHAQTRPTLEAIKPAWEALISDQTGFFLEDKGWALALHGRFASDEQVDEVLTSARALAVKKANLERFRILGGHKFLEIGPQQAHKGRTVEFLLEQFPWPGALPVYAGDDDKDEEAFAVIQNKGGIAIQVAPASRPSVADYRFPSPYALRGWLQELAATF